MPALALHALALALLATEVAPAPEPEPQIFPIRLLSLAEPAASAQESAQPAAARPALPPPPAPPRAVQKPAPPPKRRVSAAPAPVAPAVPAAPAESAPATAASAAAPTDAAGADVASGPPGPAVLGAPKSAGELDEIAVYVAQVRDLLSRYKRYPALARRHGLEGEVRLRLRIAADGSVESARADGDAAPLFARSALEAIERAGRFPSPPRGAISIEVPMRFRFEP